MAPSHASEVYSFGFIGDAGENTNKAERLRNSLLNHNVKSLINAGDNLYSPIPDFVGKFSTTAKSLLPHESYEKVWRIWREKGFDFFALAIGNHFKTVEEEVHFFQLPGPYYARVIPGVIRVIVLDSNNAENALQQAEFLSEQLEIAKERFVFLLYHHPPFTVVKVLHSVKSNHFHDVISPLIKYYRKRITALLLGHEHLALLASFYNIPCIINGAGKGTALWSPHFASKQATILWYDTRHPYWVHLQLNPITGIANCRYVNADNNQARCEFTLVTGHPISNLISF